MTFFIISVEDWLMAYLRTLRHIRHFVHHSRSILNTFYKCSVIFTRKWGQVTAKVALRGPAGASSLYILHCRQHLRLINIAKFLTQPSSIKSHRLFYNTCTSAYHLSCKRSFRNNDEADRKFSILWLFFFWRKKSLLFSDTSANTFVLQYIRVWISAKKWFLSKNFKIHQRQRWPR